MVIVGIIIQIHSDNVHIFSHYLYYQRTCNKLTTTFFFWHFFPIWRFLLILLNIGGRGCESFTPFEQLLIKGLVKHVHTFLKKLWIGYISIITPTHPPSFESIHGHAAFLKAFQWMKTLWIPTLHEEVSSIFGHVSR